MSNLTNIYRVGTTTSSPPSFVIGPAKSADKYPFVLHPSGIITRPYTPFFNAYLSAPSNGQTGAGKQAQLIADQVVSNIGEHFNTTSGMFTAPVEGIYHFACHVLVRGITSKMNNGIQYLNIGSSSYERNFGNPAFKRDLNHQVSFSTDWSGLIQAGQTASCAIQVFGGDANSAIFFGASGQQVYSGFSGYLIG